MAASPSTTTGPDAAPSGESKPDTPPKDATHKVILFYKYARLSVPLDAVVAAQSRLAGDGLHLSGRVLCAEEGVNGTLAGPPEAIAAYVRALKTGVWPEGIADGSSDALPWGTAYADTDIKGSWAVGDPFPDLKVAPVSEVVSTAGKIPDDFSRAGTHLDPVAFHEALEKSMRRGPGGSGEPAEDTGASGESGAVLLDVRNACEYAIGHFEGATEIPTRFFSEYPKWADDNVETLRGKKVFMYCTGGIRCEKASAYLRSKGVDDVYQLKGGIHRYLEAFPDGGLFQGKNFVFDKRVSLEGEKGSSTVVGKCRYCEAPHDEFSPGCVCCVCRDLVLVCGKCQASHDEYHCRTHSHLGDCYFAHLGRFTAEQLREQRGKLQELHDGLLGRVNKNKRRTLTRQIARVDERLAELSAGAGASGGAAGGAGADGDASGAAAPTLCRTCHREGCPGECWGFWAKSGAPAPTELHPALPVVPTASDAGGAAQKRKRTVSAGDAGRDNRTRTDE